MLIKAYIIKIFTHFMETGYAVEKLVKALRYRPEGSWFRFPMESMGGFKLLNPSARALSLRSTQPVTEMSNRDISWGKGG